MTADDVHAGPPTGHADLDTLADLHAGVLDEAEAERLRGHVAGCRDCTAALAALDRVQGELRSLPAPAVPAAVAARLDATLADLRTTPPTAAGPSDRTGSGADVRGRRGGGRSEEDELELARMRRGRRLSRALGAVAAAVVVVAAGGAVTAIVRTATTTSGSAAGGAGTAASAPVPAEASGSYPRTAGGATKQDSGGQPALPAYDRATLRAALPTIAAEGFTGAMADRARRTACAGSIPGTSGILRGATHIDYQGQPAYVLVYAEGGRLTGHVVTDTCGNASALPATAIDTVS